MTDRTKPYIDETYPEMMQRLRESLPPEESKGQRIQRWRQSSDPSLRLLNFFGENINIGDSVNFLRYTTAKGLELSGPLNATSATITGTIIADDGNVGGFNIGSNDIWGGNADISNAATTIVLGNLDGTSKIALGASADAITIAGTESGVIADGGGNFRVGDANNYLKWSGGNLAIKGSIIITGGSGIASLSDAGNLVTINEADVIQTNLTNSAAAGATVGANWSSNLSNRPTELTDGRVSTGLNSSGVLVSKVIPVSNVSPTGVGLYLGADFMGYYDSSAWKTYMDSSGNFYLGGSSGTLQWNGTNLTIDVSSGDAFTVKSGGNILVDSGGDIALVGDNANPAELKWTDSGTAEGWTSRVNVNGYTLRIEPLGTAAYRLYTGDDTYTESNIVLSSGASRLQSRYSGNDFSDIIAFAVTGGDPYCSLYIGVGANVGQVWLRSPSAPYFGPSGSNYIDLGKSSNKWKDGYFAGIVNIDGRLRLPVLGGIPGSPVNGDAWMEADGLHIYYGGAEKVVAGV